MCVWCSHEIIDELSIFDTRYGDISCVYIAMKLPGSQSVTHAHLCIRAWIRTHARAIRASTPFRAARRGRSKSLVLDISSWTSERLPRGFKSGGPRGFASGSERTGREQYTVVERIRISSVAARRLFASRRIPVHWSSLIGRHYLIDFCKN